MKHATILHIKIFLTAATKCISDNAYYGSNTQMISCNPRSLVKILKQQFYCNKTLNIRKLLN